MIPTRALTVKQPWATALLYPGVTRKIGEYRSWRPRIGTGSGVDIAVHAAATVDRHAREDGHERVSLYAWNTALDRLGAVRGAIIGKVRLYYITSAEHVEGLPGCPIPASGWFWGLGVPIVLPEPIPCHGQQGLWTIPEDVREQIAAQLEAPE